MKKSRLALGPMSEIITESIIRYSNFHRQQLIIIASLNQVNKNEGYVMKTKELMNFVKEMKEKYPNSDVLIERDHLGVGFQTNDLQEVYENAKEDIESGFDIIHVDLCHYQPKEKQLEETKKLIEYCLKLNSNIMIEIGTDENVGTKYGQMNIKEIENEVNYFKEFKDNIKFYVVQTGSLIKEINQVGNFNKDFVAKVSEMLKSKGIKLKAHNNDYLSKGELDNQKNIIDSMNIAPQLGVVQTMVTLTNCLIHGIDFTDFLEEVYQGGKWKKWMHNNDEKNKFLCCVIAGHYHFSSDSYKKIIEQLAESEDIREIIMNETEKVIAHYVEALE